MMKLLNRLFRKGNDESLETRLENLSGAALYGIPAYLVYPSDPISKKLFASRMQAVCDRRCGYQFMLYTGMADTQPEIKAQTPALEINETHIFWKPDSPSFCSVSTMKSPSVKTSSLRGWVESSDLMGLMFGTMIPFLNLPSPWKAGAYRRVGMHDLGESTAYNRLHGFEETHVYCHVFYLGETLYKKFILCARRNTSSWKVECTIPSRQEALLPTDTVPPGQAFGSFFPV